MSNEVRRRIVRCVRVSVSEFNDPNAPLTDDRFHAMNIGNLFTYVER